MHVNVHDRARNFQAEKIVIKKNKRPRNGDNAASKGGPHKDKMEKTKKNSIGIYGGSSTSSKRGGGQLKTIQKGSVGHMTKENTPTNLEPHMTTLDIAPKMKTLSNKITGVDNNKNDRIGENGNNLMDPPKPPDPTSDIANSQEDNDTHKLELGSIVKPDLEVSMGSTHDTTMELN
ncbi:hypothetical protein MtrunA17_Chr3g0083711 [Medicago truncatula]|uniref:Uncharacterized protein n=1 Tax=Medicago truncatula TaxID=3880 RepID=A0A396IKK5_MEDTR|nr:hypothetical protein MtrunA17_Chr3g0083711 [Medicago truncatula]